jgi:uncharacterized protein YdhG (YjbR/CyaY superfamily)
MREKTEGYTTATNTDDYISRQPEIFKEHLHQMRAIVLSLVPEATESISYQIPCFKYLYMLVGIGVNKKFSSFYTMSPSLVKSMKDQLSTVKSSGATLHFHPEEPLPQDLIRKIVVARMLENETLYQKKQKS